MTPRNGDHVTWRELNLALDPLKDDLTELKTDVRALCSAADQRSFLGPRGRELANGLMLTSGAALVSAVVSGLVAVLAG